jgi:hypothetical protein
LMFTSYAHINLNEIYFCFFARFIFPWLFIPNSLQITSSGAVRLSDSADGSGTRAMSLRELGLVEHCELCVEELADSSSDSAIRFVQ